MRNLLVLTAAGLLSVSCATTSVTDENGNKIEQRDIESVSFIKSTPPLAANLRRAQTLTVNKDLSTRYEMKDGYNKLLNEKSGTITRQQFTALTDKLNAADYTRLKPKQRPEPLVGSPTNTIIVKSDQGAHRFIDGAMTTFPEALAEVFDNHAAYMPTASAAADKKEETAAE
ncbi:MAG: hypothetical protein R3F02_13825 [Thiolinea sp.]